MPPALPGDGYLKRFPSSRIVGTDTSQAMLAAARKRLPQLSFEQGDIADWSPAEPVDLAYANASLQWVGDHQRLFPRLLSALAPGGVLAVQMPNNLDEPSHRLMRDTALTRSRRPAASRAGRGWACPAPAASSRLPRCCRPR
jgi:trans-aconitate 2-methyltransferase